jgi:hypothetical protein
MIRERELESLTKVPLEEIVRYEKERIVKDGEDHILTKLRLNFTLKAIKNSHKK